MYTDLQYRKMFRAIKNGMEVNDLCDLLSLKELEIYGLVEALNIRGYDISISEINDKKIIHLDEKFLQKYGMEMKEIRWLC